MSSRTEKTCFFLMLYITPNIKTFYLVNAKKKMGNFGACMMESKWGKLRAEEKKQCPETKAKFL